MSWHVRYFDRTLKHAVLSSEFSTKEDALEHAWRLAQNDNDVEAVEGPDDELVTVEEIGSWFDKRASGDEAAIPPITKR